MKMTLAPLLAAFSTAIVLGQGVYASETQSTYQGPSLGSVDVIGVYGQGFDFWSKVNQITEQSMSPSDILQLLDSSFDNPQEGVASFDVRYHGPVQSELRDLVNIVYFGAGVDVLAGGVATNRILPEVQAYGVYTGHIDLGVMRQAPAHESGWEYSLGTTMGAGRSTQVDGSAVDLANQYSPNNSAIFYTGVDASLGYRSQYNDLLTSHYRISLSPTYFESDFSDSGEQYQIESDQFTLRWREEDEWTLALDTPFEPCVALGLITIFGQQPTPIALLPRTWDAVHNLDPWPSAGQLVGMGTRLHLYGSHTPIEAILDGGFYGGYFGASALFHIYALQLAVGTYGFEQSAGYRTEESRIGFVSIGGRIAL